MTKKDLVKSQLETLQLKALTPEQKEEYQSQMQAYLEKRRNTRESIVGLQEKISQLEAELMQDIPTLFDAEYIHAGPAGCGFKAVLSLPREKNDKDTYYCMFCEQYFLLEADGPPKIDTKDPLIHE